LQGQKRSAMLDKEKRTKTLERNEHRLVVLTEARAWLLRR
jgi:hypothetical protein